MLVDTHTHFSVDDSISDIINRAMNSGVNYLIVSGSDFNDNKFNLTLIDKYSNIFLSVGFHPSCCNDVNEDDYDFLESILKSSDKVVAIGEIGLDYHYSNNDKDKQIIMFKRQLDLAVKYDLPVVIHSRDAFLDTYNILKEYNVKGVIHCFSGSYETAKMYIDLGYLLGIGGVVTFKNSKLKDVVKKIGLKNIVLETDSPYLSPFRGEKNESCNVRVVAEFLANYLGEELDYVENITTFNASSLFDLKI